jgi:CPA1 family monovalent cation:H+ antiporter
VLQDVSLSEIVSGIIVLLLIAAIMHAVTRRFRLPFTVVLVLVGIGLSSGAAVFPGVAPPFHQLQASSSLILYVFLPTLIFESALRLDFQQLRENLSPVLLLAVPGLLLSTAILGGIVWLTTPLPLAIAMLLGAILSATDPVAVISVFRRLGAPQRLKILVEGESLFNDATAIVLARIILGVVIAGTLSAKTIPQGALEFLAVCIGGLAVGSALGLLTGFVLGKIADRFVEITLTTVLAYLSFLLAERVLHVSGVMATIAAGLTLGGWGRLKLSVGVKAYFDHFWEYMAFIANALIFLMVGLRVDLGVLWEARGLLLWVIVALLVSRAAVVYGLMPLVGRLPNSTPVNLSYRTVMFWGGLRGAIALAIALSLPTLDQRQGLIVLVMGAVLFTLIVQGLTVEPLMRVLGLDRPLSADRLATLESHFTAKQRALEDLPTLIASGVFSGGVVLRLLAQYQDDLDLIRTEIVGLQQTEINDEQLRMLLYLRVLLEEEALLVDLFHKGQLSERAFRQLIAALHNQVDGVRSAGEYHDLPPYSLRRHRLKDSLTRILSRLPALTFLTERLSLDRIALDYEIAGARHQSSKRVLDTLEGLARLESTPRHVVDEVRREYRQKYEDAQGQLDQIAERFPEFISDLQERLGRRLLLVSEAEAIRTQAANGTLSPAVAELMAEEIASNVRSLGGYDVATLRLGPMELLRNVPAFRNLSADDIANIAIRMRFRKVAAGETITRQGQQSGSMFFITQGVVRLCREENGVSRDVATMITGDSFGEWALLKGQPDRVSATSVSPCSLYSLHRDDLEVAMAARPAIRQALERESDLRRDHLRDVS